MIDLTVKTLDSQNHAFSLNDDITVRQFKEHIADTVNISVDLQRLIYCGRVLQDEKLLSEYDVNGKVIHLVQRAPPSLSQRSHNSSQSQGQGQGGTGEWQTPRVYYRQTQFNDDPMYIGSFSIPADVLEGYEWPTPSINNTLVNSHLTVVRRMLDQANNVIDRLDNPTASSSTSTSTENNSSSSQSNQTQSTTASAATAAASSASTWTASSDSTNEVNIPVSKTNDNISASQTTEISDANREPPQDEEEGGGEQQQEQQHDDATQHSTPTSNRESSHRLNNETSVNDALVPRELAELLEMLLTTQDRLRPYIRNRLLSVGATAWRQPNSDENQRIIDGVTECFHFLSHAQHALSNLNVNMQQPPPRSLRCRPMMLQPSAILQAGLPIQVEAHISVHGQNENNPDGDDSGTNTPRSSTGSNQTTTSAGNETPVSIGANAQTQFQQQQQSATPSESSQQIPRQQQSHSQTAFGTVFNFPNNVEVVMEPTSQTPRVWSFSTGGSQGLTTNNNNNNTVNNNNGSTTSGPNGGTTGGSFPWGGAPSPDIIRNLMQAVAGYMAQTGVPHAPASTTSSPTVNPSSNTTTSMGCPRHRTPNASNESTAISGQNSQTRGNTETHPTTSTQTRTTSRTHVFHQHAQALGVGVGLTHNLDFDPFLPCNSHYIRRGNSSSSSSSASTATAAAGAPTNIAPSTQTAGQNNASTGAHGPISARTIVASAHPRVATIRGVQIVDNLFDNTSLAESIANSERISSSLEGGIPFSRVLTNRGINLLVDYNSRDAGLIRVIFSVLGNISVHLWFRIVRGDITPLTDLIFINLRTRIREYFGGYTSTNMPIIIWERLFNELTTALERSFDGERPSDENDRAIDIYLTVKKMLKKFFVKLTMAIFNDEIVVTNIVQIIRDFGRNLTGVLRYSFGQLGLERVITRFASEMSRGTHVRFREWILGTVVDWFLNYTREIPQIRNAKIIEKIVYKTHMNVVATTSSEAAQSKPESVTEPMEVDAEPNPVTHNSWMFDDDVPIFPGHENLLPDWIPIVARDGVTQRRQLSLSDDDVTTMSDAYLATMPSKRRKLVEQRKAPLLVSATSNRSVIPSSMERLLRESVGRAGFEEVDGAVAAIVADPTVRRAFGQAIRESLNPRRYQTPDFPDEHRFPNATKFFTNPNSPTKQ